MGEEPSQPTAAGAATPHSRKNPFLAELIRHENLTQPGSLKDTRHFVINLAGSGLSYTPGDSLGAFGRNPPALVDELISLLGFNPETVLTNPKGQQASLRKVLSEDVILNRANRKIMSGL